MGSNDNHRRNGGSFAKAFWFAFLGLTFVFALLWFGSLLVESLLAPTPSSGNETLREKPPVAVKMEQAFQKVMNPLSQDNKKILRRAWEKSQPEIERLKRETLEDIRRHTRAVLNRYFSQAQREGVERFLDWLYSFGTDYVVVFKKAEGVLKNNSAMERYIRQKVETYLINPPRLNRLLKEEVIPYADRKVKEFVEKSQQILIQNYRRELEKEARRVALQLREKGEIKGLGEKEIDQIVRYVSQRLEQKLWSDVKKRVTQKVESFITGVLTFKILTKVTHKMAVKLSQKIVAKITAKIIAKAGQKMASKIGASLVGFESGVLACAWAGPFSVVCGLAAGTAAWVATDVVINKLDEAISRDEMRDSLRKYLSDVQDNLLRAVVKVYEEKLNHCEDKLKEISGDGVNNLKIKELPKVVR